MYRRMKIDSHLHFWNYEPVKDAWITDEMGVLKQDFSPDQLLPLCMAQGIEAGVAVQADQSEAETAYLIGLSQAYGFIQGVVGWVNLRSPDVADRLDHFSQYSVVKGYRHIVQSEQQDDFLLREDFCLGVAELGRRGLTYDVLIYPKHLPYALEFVRRFPNQRFMVDHIAKPAIREGQFETWRQALEPFGREPHVSCKIAGLTTEAHWHVWQYGDFARYLDAVLEIFGSDRLVFGSDWPVCLVGADYAQTCRILSENIAQLGEAEKEKIWGGNCTRFYNLQQ
jgi:L-fuconolactonase